MADRCELAPGQRYIEVEYDYEYKSRDRMITIRQGECYLLVKKTNEDWWQVRKDEVAKPFYVPAQYVREVRRALMPPPKPLPHASGAVGTRGGSKKSRPTALDLKQSDENLNKRSPAASPPAGQQVALQPPKDDKGSPKSPKRQAQHTPPNAQHGSLPRTRAGSPLGIRALLDLDEECSREDETVGDGEKERKRGERDGEKERKRGERVGDGETKGEVRGKTTAPREKVEKNLNDSESGDELSSSSTEQLQGRPDSPVYTNLQQLKISGLPPLPSGSPLSTNGDWETHRDASGRHFYYNRSTQERTWKPPRARDSITRKEGRHENSTETESNPPPTMPGSGDTPKTRSLDRRQPAPIVLTKWRHSAYLLEANDGDLLKTGTPELDNSDPSSPPKHPHSPSEKSGNLNVTKITEQGKKVRKNWTSSWAVLQGSMLIFAKSPATASSWFGHQSKPEFSVDLKGATVERASKDKTSKKNVLEVKTRQGTEFLIQSDTESVINEWFKSLTDAINTHAWESDEAIEEDMPESPGADKPDREKEQQKKTKTKLKKFLTRRPTLQAVRDKGYIRDQVFGCNLINLCQREKTTVPHFVKMCVDHVENHGLSLDGLYRVSGNLAVIQKLRFAVNHDEKMNLEDSKWEDIHVTTGALKMFFRELPEPLFSFALFNDFVSAIKILEYKQKVQAIKELVKQLPRPHHDTMQTLFKHLRKVIDHSEENRMTSQSVAIVFGPTLLRPEVETLNMAVHMVYQNQIVELILLEYEAVFGR